MSEIMEVYVKSKIETQKGAINHPLFKAGIERSSEKRTINLKIMENFFPIFLGTYWKLPW